MDYSTSHHTSHLPQGEYSSAHKQDLPEVKKLRSEAESNLKIKHASLEKNNQKMDYYSNRLSEVNETITIVSRSLNDKQAEIDRTQKTLKGLKFTAFGSKLIAKHKIKKYTAESNKIKDSLRSLGVSRGQLNSKLSSVTNKSSIAESEIELIDKHISDIDELGKSISNELDSEKNELDDLGGRVDKSDSESAKRLYSDYKETYSNYSDTKLEIVENKIKTSSKEIEILGNAISMEKTRGEIDVLKGGISNCEINIAINIEFMKSKKKSDPAYAAAKKKIESFESRQAILKEGLKTKEQQLSELKLNNNKLTGELDQLMGKAGDLKTKFDDYKSKLPAIKLQIEEDIKKNSVDSQKTPEKTAAAVSGFMQSIFSFFSK